MRDSLESKAPSGVTFGFECEGLRLAATLFAARGPAPAPAVLLCHGGGGVQEIAVRDYAARFATAGVTAMTFDYSSWGDSDGEPRHVIDLAVRHREIMAALDVLKAQACVDSDRVALWGTSLGGGQVLHVAARRPDVAAVVIQCAAVDPLALTGALSAGQMIRLTLAGVQDAVRRALGLAPTYVGLVGEPGSLAVMTTPDTLAEIEALSPGGLPIPNKVAARLVLDLALYKPLRKARKITAPVLVCVAEEDSLFPGDVQRKAATLAPRGEAAAYAAGHFGIYHGAWFEAVVEDQTRFLTRVLDPAGAA
jgi:dienelactone hydrolase